MTGPKPAPASAHTIHSADLTAEDPVGLPMVDERGRSHIRRFTLGSLRDGRGEIGVEARILGAVAADEIDDLCAELLAMRDAALAAQYREQLETERAREVHRLALRHSTTALDAALDDPDGFDAADRELIEDAIAMRADYAAAGVTLGGAG